MNKILVIAIILLIGFGIGLPAYKLINQQRIIVIENTDLNSSENIAGSFSVNQQDLSEVKNERINTVFLGIPGEGNAAPNLTDTLMIMSVDPKTETGFLLSIPRDFLIKIPETNYYTKINSLYQQKGVKSVKTVLSEITGLEFDYNLVIDLSGVRQIVDQLGGIDIFVEKEIYDPIFPRENNSYQLFTLQEGWQHLDGETTLKYIRTRHDPDGDFARMQRQQKVLTALKEKMFSLHPIWNLAAILDLWHTMNDHFQATNISLKDLRTFWQITRNICFEDLEFKVLDPSTGLIVSDHVTLGGQQAYVLRPKSGINNYQEIKGFIKTLSQ